MDITVDSTFLPHIDPDASLTLYRDVLGVEVHVDVGHGSMRGISFASAGQPSTSIMLEPPYAGSGVTDQGRGSITEMMAKGTFKRIILATRDLDGTFEEMRATAAKVVQEPSDQPYGVRGCAFRAPAGNLVRIKELS